MAKEVVIPEDPQEFLAFLQAETRKYRESRKWIYWIVYGLGGFVVLAELYLASVKGKRPDLMSIGPLFALVGIAAGLTPQLRAASAHAAKLEEPRYAPFLLEVFTSEDKEIIDLARSSLKKSLRRIDDSVEFDVESRRALLARLRETDDVEFAEAIAVALDRVGTIDEVPELEKIASGGIRLKDGARDRVVADLRMVLGNLRMRQAKRVIEARVAESEGAKEVEEARLQLDA